MIKFYWNHVCRRNPTYGVPAENEHTFSLARIGMSASVVRKTCHGFGAATPRRTVGFPGRKLWLL